VLDIKPYIPQYDNPQWNISSSSHVDQQPCSDGHADQFRSIDCGDQGNDEDVNLTRTISETVQQGFATQLDCSKELTAQGTDKHSGSLENEEGVCNSCAGNVEMRTSLEFPRCHDKLEFSQSCKLEQNKHNDFELSQNVESLKENLESDVTASSSAKSCQNIPEHVYTESSHFLSEHLNTSQTIGTKMSIASADWIQSPPIQTLKVMFTNRAEEQLKNITSQHHQIRKILGAEATRQTIVSILAADPRSTYRRQQCGDRLYYFCVDSLHITCWFDENVVEVLKIVCQSKTENKY
jgi:hypothetical protein